MLGYFGCDQSQVQRYLTAKSVDAGRQSLLMSAFAKIPLQVLILMMGVLVFCFYLFAEPPMLFNQAHQGAIEASGRAGEYRALDDEFRAAHAGRRSDAAEVVAARQAGDTARAAAATEAFVESDRRVGEVRARARGLVRDVTGGRRLYRRQLRLPDVHHYLPAGRPGRPADRRHLRRRHGRASPPS